MMARKTDGRSHPQAALEAATRTDEGRRTTDEGRRTTDGLEEEPEISQLF